jgi:hypothetical protein
MTAPSNPALLPFTAENYRVVLRHFDEARKVLMGLSNDVALADFFEDDLQIDVIVSALELAARTPQEQTQ